MGKCAKKLNKEYSKYHNFNKKNTLFDYFSLQHQTAQKILQFS